MPFSKYRDFNDSLRVFNEDDTVVIRRLIKPDFPSSVQVPDVPEYQSNLIYEVRIENGKRRFLPAGHVLVRTYIKTDEMVAAESDKKLKQGSSREFRLITAENAILFIQGAGGEPIPELLEIAYANLDASSCATVLQDSTQEVESTTDTKATTSQPDKGQARKRGRKAKKQNEVEKSNLVTTQIYVKWAESLEPDEAKYNFIGKTGGAGYCTERSIKVFKDYCNRNKIKVNWNSRTVKKLRATIKNNIELKNKLDKVIYQGQ